MTTIIPIDRSQASASVRLPAVAHAVLLASVAALLVLLGALGFLTSIVTPADMQRAFTRQIEMRALGIGRVDKSCGIDGAEVEGGPLNCLDYRGFRIVKGERLLVFSMRYSKPLFVFGIQSGMMFVNEKRNVTLIEAEKSAIFGYLHEAG